VDTRVLIVLVAIVTIQATPARAQNDEDLAKKLNNPVSDLVSMPLQ